MIKIENMSAGEITLMFEDEGKNQYTKRLGSNSVVTITPQEFSRLIEPTQATAEVIKVTKYNIVGELRGKVELINQSFYKILIKFVRGNEIHYKSLPANASLVLKESEFEHIHDLDPRIQVNRGEEHKIFFFTRSEEKKIAKEDIIPDVSENSVVVEAHADTEISFSTKNVEQIKDKLVEEVKSYKKKAS